MGKNDNLPFPLILPSTAEIERIAGGDLLPEPTSLEDGWLQLLMSELQSRSTERAFSHSEGARDLLAELSSTAAEQMSEDSRHDPTRRNPTRRNPTQREQDRARYDNYFQVKRCPEDGLKALSRGLFQVYCQFVLDQENGHTLSPIEAGLLESGLQSLGLELRELAEREGGA